MPDVIPTKISRIERQIEVRWSDGHVGIHTLGQLRDSCPCAGCKGETVLLRHYQPEPPDRSTPGRYTLASIQQVGAYAIQLGWGDGHTSGIYTWDRLRAACECRQCSGEKNTANDHRPDADHQIRYPRREE